MREIRQILGDSAKTPTYVATVHRRGYRFIAETQALDTPDADKNISTQAAEATPASRHAFEGERKQATVLCCALADSLTIAETIGPDAMHALLRRFFDLSLDVVRQYEGAINQFLGDGLMALFGAPLSLEDHARRAVLAAVALQNILQEADLGKPYDVDCRFRVGLNSGLVVVGRIGDHPQMPYAAIGETTNVADCLRELAEPGDIVISEATCRLVTDDVQFKALPAIEVVARSEPLTPYKVLGARPRQASFVHRGENVLSPFVGREREMDTLDALCAQAALGQGQIVGVIAEAGQGKSRLLYEFRHRLQDRRPTYLTGRCLPYGGNTPYLPLIDIVRQRCRITEADSLASLIEKVHDTLQKMQMDEESPAYVLQLLGVKEGTESIADLAPGVVRSKTFEILQHILLHSSSNQFLVLEIEDLHWIDKTSEAYLELLSSSLVGASILLLTSYRPGYRPLWIDKSYATQLPLKPLMAQDALMIVQATHHQTVLPEPMIQTIIAKAEGNPFFLEQLTHIVQEQLHQSTELTVPDTIQGVLMARLDRLDESAKRLLQTASVLGRAFPLSLLDAIRDETDSLDAALQELKRLEFFYERPGGREPIYVFKHILTQEVAYESLLSMHRRAFHAQAGQALERLHPDSLTERYEELSHHFTLGQVWDRAFEYLLKSGDKARRAFANQEARSLYTQAIDVSERATPDLEASKRLPAYEGRGLIWMQLTKLDEAIADFQIMRQLARLSGDQYKEGESLCRLARAHQMTFSEEAMPFVEAYAQEALQLSRQTKNRQMLAMSLTELGHLDAKRGDLPEADRKFETALQISREEGHKDSLVLLLFALSRQANWQGDFQRAIEFGHEGMLVSRDIHDGNNELTNCFFLSLACWGAGRYAQALAVIEEGRTKAKARQNWLNVIRLTNTLGWFYREFGDLSRALACDHESVDMGHAYSLPDPEISALINLGLDYLALGQYERARSYLEPTLQRVEYEAFGVHRWRWKIRLFIGLAELFYSTGAYEQAQRYVEEGVQEAQATSSRKYIALGRALRGKIAATLGHADRAGEELRRALAVAEQLASPSLVHPIAFEWGHWCESMGRMRQASSAYTRAQTAIEHMIGDVEDNTLRSTLSRSALATSINEAVERLR